MTGRWLLEEMVKELDEIPRFYTADIFRQCVNALKTNPQMIIVDEIDYLLKDFRTIETLRDLHDETGVPIILVGMQLAKHKLKKHTHLFDRISEFYNFTEFEYSDIKQITEDDTYVNELLRKNVIKLEEAKNHPQKHVLTKAIGVFNDLNIEVNKLYKDKGYLLLCTDGLTNMVEDNKILEIVKKTKFEKLADKYIEVANSRGGADNTTVVVVKL